MEEKKFLMPEAEIVSFNKEDIIATSDGQIASIDIDGMPIYQ